MIHDLIAQHVRETGSAFAQGLLDNWEGGMGEAAEALGTRARITHIVPAQYVAMSAAMETASESDVDFEQAGAWENLYETVMEGAH